MHALVLGIGNPLRHDDGAGPAVLHRLQASSRWAGVDFACEAGDGARIIDCWQGYDRVWVIDACCSGSGPGSRSASGAMTDGSAQIGVGSIRRLDAIAQPLPPDFVYTSSHLFGLVGAIETARALQRLPDALIVYAIEGGNFDHGEGLSAEVTAAVATLAVTLDHEIAAYSEQTTAPYQTSS